MLLNGRCWTEQICDPQADVHDGLSMHRNRPLVQVLQAVGSGPTAIGHPSGTHHYKLTSLNR